MTVLQQNSLYQAVHFVNFKGILGFEEIKTDSAQRLSNKSKN